MNEQKHFQKDEDYPLRLLKQQCLKRGLDFVCHCGLRALLYNGAFFGLTTLKEWNYLEGVREGIIRLCPIDCVNSHKL